MEPLMIGLIIAGIVVIAVSFIFSDRLSGDREEKEIEEYKEELKSEMDRVLDRHVGRAQSQLDDAVKMALQDYVEEAQREIRVTVNEAKEYMESLTAQAQAKMEEYVKQAQDDAAGISDETKQSLEKICAAQQEKIQECSQNVINEINNHHNEVTFLYSMINNKQDEIKEEVKIVEQVREEAKDLAAEVELVKIQANAMNQISGNTRKEFISQIKEELKQEFSEDGAVTANDRAPQPEAEPTKAIDSTEIKEVLHNMTRENEPDAAAAGESGKETGEPEVVVADVEIIEDISVQTVKAAVEDVIVEELQNRKSKNAKNKKKNGKNAKNKKSDQAEKETRQQEKSKEKAASVTAPESKEKSASVKEPESKEEPAAVNEADQRDAEKPEADEKAAPDAQKEEKASDMPETTEKDTGKESAAVSEDKKMESADADEKEPEQADQKERAEAEAAASEAPAADAPEEKQVPEDIVLEDAPNKMLRVVRESGTVSTDADVEMRMKVLSMYDQGYASMDIAEELKLGIGEVRMIIDLYSRRER